MMMSDVHGGGILRAPRACAPVRGNFSPPGSKSLTQRYMMLAALADGGARSLVAHGRLSDFRAFIGHVGTAAHGCTLAAGEAMAMGIGIGDEVRHVGF